MADMTGRGKASPLRKKKAALWLLWIAGCLGLLALVLLAWLPAREARVQLTEFEDVEMLERRIAAIRSQPDPMQVTMQDWVNWHRFIPRVHDESGWLQQLRMLSRDNGINVKKLRFVERRLLPAAGEQAVTGGESGAATMSDRDQRDAGEDGAAPYGEAPSEGAEETSRQEQAVPVLEAWIYELDGVGEYNDWLSWLSSLQGQERLHRLENWAIQHSYSTDDSRQGGGSDVFNMQVIIHVYAAPGSDAWASG
ncbi:hypothetical protein L5D93_17985 [Paenibacillus thiaminolyticus]|nr:hypothetical protein [Paenibacillus thiaminolyticus]